MNPEGPKYLALYAALRDEIIRGEWPCGMRLPSRRQIAQERGLSVVTVEHCYELLCQEGYAEARPRSGHFVTYRAADGFAAAEPPLRPAPEAEPSAGGEERFPFSVLARAMRKVLADYGEAILDKAPNAGCESLRRALCASHSVGLYHSFARTHNTFPVSGACTGGRKVL